MKGRDSNSLLNPKLVKHPRQPDRDNESSALAIVRKTTPGGGEKRLNNTQEEGELEDDRRWCRNAKVVELIYLVESRHHPPAGAAHTRYTFTPNGSWITTRTP